MAAPEFLICVLLEVGKGYGGLMFKRGRRKTGEAKSCLLPNRNTAPRGNEWGRGLKGKVQGKTGKSRGVATRELYGDTERSQRKRNSNQKMCFVKEKGGKKVLEFSAKANAALE